MCFKALLVLRIDGCITLLGKNASNVGVHDSLVGLGTTQKAVMNAVYSLDLHKDESADARHIAMDNRYQCPELAVMLCEHAGGICSMGTIRSNRKGWDKEKLTLGVKGRKPARGTYTLFADVTNKFLSIQWMDSKVVSLVTTTNITSIGSVKQQVGANSLEVTCPDAIIQYQRTMFGVDKGDQFRMHGGGFSNKAHFKKWYKKTFLAILDCMLMNAVLAWNMAATEDSTKLHLARHDFMHIIAEDMMNYVDERSEVSSTPATSRAGADWSCTHLMENCEYGEQCAVCKLEANLNPELGQENMAKKIVTCSLCMIPAHPAVQADSNRQIHQLEAFKGMSCFAILHSEEGRKIWRPKPEGKVRYSVNRSADIVRDLREYHGLPRKSRRSRQHSQDDEYTSVLVVLNVTRLGIVLKFLSF